LYYSPDLLIQTSSQEDKMKALTIHNSAVTKESLLEMAQQSPETWIGIRIAAGLLILKGWTSSQVAELFDVSRWTAVQWIQRLNNQGIEGLEEQPRPGRPVRMTEEIQTELEQALMSDPRDLGLSRNRWDGVAVVEYLEREHGVHLKVRQAQRWIRRLGFSLRRPIYRYAQAASEGIESFSKEIKKTSATSKKQKH
jgi:transposase